MTIYIYFIVIFITLLGIALLTYSITQSTRNAQVIVALQSLLNQVIMLISALLVVGAHFRYNHNYPLQRDARSEDPACIIHSALSVPSLFVPSESLMIMTLIHYRIIFWSKYTKISITTALIVTIVTWVIIIGVAGTWVSVQSRFIGWYCIPYHAVNDAWWLSITIQVIITLTSLVCGFVCVGCYSKIVLYIHREEITVRKMVTRKTSNTRKTSIRFTITCTLYFTQAIIMNVLIWLPTYDATLEATESWMYICYVLSVIVCDVYVHAYVKVRLMLKKLL